MLTDATYFTADKAEDSETIRNRLRETGSQLQVYAVSGLYYDL